MSKAREYWPPWMIKHFGNWELVLLRTMINHRKYVCGSFVIPLHQTKLRAAATTLKKKGVIHWQASEHSGGYEIVDEPETKFAKALAKAIDRRSWHPEPGKR